MTAEKALEIIDIAIAEVEWEYPLEYAVAFEMAKKALEKQIPKKVDMEKHSFMGDICPNCNKPFGRAMGNYCQHCGQALDWSDTE